jgi:hypothetical protein
MVWANTEFGTLLLKNDSNHAWIPMRGTDY